MSYNLANNDPKQIRRDVRATVLGVAGFIAIMYLVSFSVLVLAVVGESFGALVQEVLASDGDISMAQSEALVADVLETTEKYAGLASLLSMLCGVPLFFAIRGKRFVTSDIPRVHSKISIATLVTMLVFIMGIQGVMVLIQLGLELLFNQQGANPATDMLEQSTTSLALTPLGALYIVLLGPICEELVFRGAVMRKLERYGANFAIIISSLLFGLYHMFLFQAFFAFFAGLIFAYTAGRFSLKWAMVLHIINNGMAILPLYVGGDVLGMGMNLCFLAMIVVSIVILVVKRKLLFAQIKAGAPSEPRVFSRAFVSPWLIIYLVLCVLSGVSLINLA